MSHKKQKGQFFQTFNEGCTSFGC